MIHEKGLQTAKLICNENLHELKLKSEQRCKISAVLNVSANHAKRSLHDFRLLHSTSVSSDVVVVLKEDKRWSKTDFHPNRQVEGSLLSRTEQVIRCVLITQVILKACRLFSAAPTGCLTRMHNGRYLFKHKFKKKERKRKK